MVLNNFYPLTAVNDVVSNAGIGVEEIQKGLDSAKTTEEKTSFLIEYLLGQRAAMMDFAKTVILSIIVFAIGRKIVKLLLKITNKWMVRKEVEISVQKFIMSVAGVIYNLLLIFVVAGILGVGTSSIVAMVGSAGLAIGLALQGSLSNFAGGVLILLLKPFKVGDYISAAGAEGTVQSIDIFYTRIYTTDNKVVVIPNGTISNTNVTNTSKQDERMLILDFMVSYDTDIEKVRELIMGLLDADKFICHDKPMSVVVDKLNPMRIKMLAKAWVKTDDYWDVRYRLLEEIKVTLQDNNINIS
ncbi:MAG: mechanosensitive ion channel [Lachnospiraceae bacterium]|nr:mechanosensitive ion channel [Lachnospiraceae bacterium]